MEHTIFAINHVVSTFNRISAS